ncbi:acyl-CoA carboxylase subunit epsilon [Microbispora sp. NPDC049125]|uniref:acyl-CoA carboxylase subunit epsilon n=1 Tax=Microbispora sp. NPDC049125 TaxID=3154929 RepID=UPI003467824C
MTAGRPYLRILRGDASPEEIAALLAAAAVSSSETAGQPAPVTSEERWRDPARRLRRELPHGPGAWRGAFLPHSR